MSEWPDPLPTAGAEGHTSSGETPGTPRGQHPILLVAEVYCGKCGQLMVYFGNKENTSRWAPAAPKDWFAKPVTARCPVCKVTVTGVPVAPALCDVLE